MGIWMLLWQCSYSRSLSRPQLPLILLAPFPAIQRLQRLQFSFISSIRPWGVVAYRPWDVLINNPRQNFVNLICDVSAGRDAEDIVHVFEGCYFDGAREEEPDEDCSRSI